MSGIGKAKPKPKVEDAKGGEHGPVPTAAAVLSTAAAAGSIGSTSGVDVTLQRRLSSPGLSFLSTANPRPNQRVKLQFANGQGCLNNPTR